MNTAQVTLRVPSDLLEQMDSAAAKTNTSRSEVFRDAAQSWLKGRRQLSAHEQLRDLCGKFEGAPEASTSKDYKKRFGRD